LKSISFWMRNDNCIEIMYSNVSEYSKCVDDTLPNLVITAELHSFIMHFNIVFKIVNILSEFSAKECTQYIYKSTKDWRYLLNLNIDIPMSFDSVRSNIEGLFAFDERIYSRIQCPDLTFAFNENDVLFKVNHHIYKMKMIDFTMERINNLRINHCIRIFQLADNILFALTSMVLEHKTYIRSSFKFVCYKSDDDNFAIPG